MSIRNKLTEKKNFRKTDAAAIILCIALFAYLVYAATQGFDSEDECVYYTIPQRLLKGDRLLIDEWHVEQLSSVLLALPYWLITTLTGSTEGIILSLRFTFLAVDLILYWYLYGKMRPYGAVGLIPIVLFAVNIPMAIITLNYYSMSLHGLAVICALLFFRKKQPSVPALLLTGIVIACTVLAEPILAFLYFAWSILFFCGLTAQKRGKRFLDDFRFVLHPKVWQWITAGILLTAAAFFAFLLSRSSPAEIFRVFPELFSDSEYSFAGGSRRSIFSLFKLWQAIRFYGVVPPVLGTAVLVLSLIERKKKQKDKKRKALLFAAACVCFTAAYLCAVVMILCVPMMSKSYTPTYLYYYNYHSAPIFFLGLNCYLLCEEKNPRLFCVWLLSAAASVLIDTVSEHVIGFCGVVACFELVPAFFSVLRELRAGQPAPAENDAQSRKRHRKGFVPVVAAVCLIVFFAWESYGVYALGFYQIVEDYANPNKNEPLSAVADRGPMKGIHTTAHIRNVYDLILDDLDVIKADCSGTFYVSELRAFFYLYADLPFGCYDTWYVEADSETRAVRYWELLPERRPQYIYLPLYDNYTYEEYLKNPERTEWVKKKLAFFQQLCRCEITQGKAGYIIHVIQWD